MPNIAEHHSKEEREGDCCEDRRVDLSVSGHTIGVCDLLSNGSVAVSVEGSGRLCGLYFLQLWSGHYSVYSLHEDFLLRPWKIQICDNEVLSQLHLIQ